MNTSEVLVKSVYGFSARTSEGKNKSMEQYKGKVLLIVNTATMCGFSKQLGSLQDIHAKFGGKGFELLAFPCNQFANQEPRNGEEISDFCKMNYGVTFKFFDKIMVNGEGASPLFLYLQEVAPGLLGSKWIKWNFTKFLINKDGIPVKRYSPMTPPEKIIPDIIKLMEKNEL
jgi:glutathione peroxidase